jgi:hypothetical protein
MNIKRTAALSATAAVLLAGCGGGDGKSDSNKTLSYSALSSEANTICKDTSAELKALGSPTGDATPENADLIDKGVAIQKKASAKLKDLKAPDKLKSTLDEFTANVDAQISGIEEAAKAARAGDQAAFLAAVKAVHPLDTKSDDLGSKLGAADCAKTS